MYIMLNILQLYIIQNVICILYKMYYVFEYSTQRDGSVG